MSAALRLQVHWEKNLHIILDCVNRFPKSQRFLFSNRIASLSIELLEEINRVRYLPKNDQFESLSTIDSHFSRLGLLLRLCHDRRYISTGQLEQFSITLQQSGGMVGKWKKHLINN